MKKLIPKNISGKLKSIKDSTARQVQDDNYLVSLDIGTEYVKVLTSQYEGDNHQVIGIGKSHQEPTAMTAGAVSDISKVIEACDRALMKSEKMSGVSPRKAVIGVAGELVKGRADIVNYNRENPKTEITEEELKEIMLRCQEAAYKKAKQELTWEAAAEDLDIKIVNSAIIFMEIDGYKVTNPIGFQGKKFKIQVYNSFAPLVHVGALEKIASELDLELITISAEPYAVARAVLGPEGNSEVNSIFVDIGGGTTDIALVNEGGIDGTKMFGIGGRSFTRAITNSLKLDSEKAENLKLKYSKVGQTKNEQLRKSIDSVVELWSEALAISLQDLADGDRIPSSIMLCGGGAGLPDIQKVLKSNKWIQNLDMSERVKVKNIGINDVKRTSDNTGKINDHRFITALGLLRVGHDVISLSKASTIQSAVNRLLKV